MRNGGGASLVQREIALRDKGDEGFPCAGGKLRDDAQDQTGQMVPRTRVFECYASPTHSVPPASDGRRPGCGFLEREPYPTTPKRDRQHRRSSDREGLAKFKSDEERGCEAQRKAQGRNRVNKRFSAPSSHRREAAAAGLPLRSGASTPRWMEGGAKIRRVKPVELAWP